MAETSTKPYLVRALYEWCCDNGYTPYLAVSVDAGTVVPRQYVRNGEIVLNVSPAATHQLVIGNERIEFQARFSGVAQGLSIPVGNVTAVYARETGHGMAFEVSRAPALAPEHADAPVEATDELARRRQNGAGGPQTPGDGRRRDADERAAADRDRGGRAAGGDGGDGEPAEAGGAEVIAFGPDAARRRRRDGATDGPAGPSADPSSRPVPRAAGEAASLTPAPGGNDPEPSGPGPAAEDPGPGGRREGAGGRRRGDRPSRARADVAAPGAAAAADDRERSDPAGGSHPSADGPAPEPPDDGDGGGNGNRRPRLTRVK